jgi:hypothetical protein
MKRYRCFACFVLFLLAVGGRASFAAQAGQDIDPFYLNALAAGEAHFKAKAFGQAVASLEIAAFGLFARPAELGRARLLQGLCHGYLGVREKIEPELRSAYALLGTDGLAKAEIPDWARADLVKLLKSYQLEAPATAALRTLPALPSSSGGGGLRPTPAAGDKAALERIIRENPRQAAAYFDLAAWHEAAGDLAAARRVYQNMLAKIPAEIRAYYETGRLFYLERGYKDAGKWLERYLGFTADLPADPRLVAAAKAYLILSAERRGDAAKVRTTLRLKPALDEAIVRSLDLSAADRDRLLRLLRG